MQPVNFKTYPTSKLKISDKGKTRVALVALNVPGYYSLPIRTLFLLTRESNELRKNFAMRFIEMDVDQNADIMLTVFTDWQPDLIGLSVNVWNRNSCIRLAQAIKCRLPESVILAGGQEVTGSVIDYLDFVPEFDYVIDGEGEIPFQQFLKNWDPVMRTLRDPKSVSGLHYRIENHNAFTGPARLVSALDQIPSPVLADLVPLDSKQKLGVLLEASRGCPFRCSYCFEGSKNGSLRTVSIERLVEEIDTVVDRGGSYFHIMDPILCMKDLKRLRQLTDHIKNLSKDRTKIIFSVEAYAEHVTEDVADCLKVCAIIDVGLQSINPATLKEIHRKYLPDKFKRGLNHLRQAGASFNLYLICGLPHETLLTYLRGVVYVVNEKPKRIFFNELCLLNGTELRKRADEYGYLFSSDPPYQVYQTNWMRSEELKLAQALSKAIEKRYNLSSSAIYPRMPWAQVDTANDYGTRNCYIDGECSWSCTGCSIWNTSPSNNHHDSLYTSMNQADVEIYTADGVDKNKLLQLLGQLHLAGTSRIKLRTPPRLLCDADFVELLIQRGIWHFITFEGRQGDFRCDDAVEADRQLLSGLDNLNRVFALRGQAQIRPFVEVIVFPNGIDPSIIKPRVRRLAARNVSIINFPAHIQCLQDDWMDALSQTFATGLTSRSWLKMPEIIVRKVLDGVENIDEIISIFYQLDLLSRESVHPPCFWHEEMEATAPER
jgi:radical SAM superfamily enzyme YgiQ (UPF0313 family)